MSTNGSRNGSLAHGPSNGSFAHFELNGNSMFEDAVSQLRDAHKAEMRALRATLEGELPRPRQPVSSHHQAAERKGADAPVDYPEVSAESNEVGHVKFSSSCECFENDEEDIKATTFGAPTTPEDSQTHHSENESDDAIKTAQKPKMSSRLNALESLLGGSHQPMQDDSSGRLEGFVKSGKFEWFSTCTVCAFCVVTALELQADGLRLGYKIGYANPNEYTDISGTGWDLASDVLQWVSMVLGCLFGLEICLRLAGLRKSFFYDIWNYIDVMIFFGWCIEIVGFETSASPKVLRPMRIVRLLRFIKMVKYIRRLESLYFMAQALNGSMRIFGWSCVFLFALQGLTAFVITELLNAFYFGQGNDLQDERVVFEYFGSFVRSLLTTFEMAMGNWPIPARILFERVSEWFILFSLVHKLFVGFAVIAVINAVFVQETLQVAMTDDLAMVLKKERVVSTTEKKLKTLFMAADTSADAKVDLDEFKEILRHHDVRLWLASLDYETNDNADVQCLFELLDDDNSGALSCKEFVHGMLRLRGQAKAMDVINVRSMMKKEIETHGNMMKKEIETHAISKDFRRSRTPIARSDK